LRFEFENETISKLKKYRKGKHKRKRENKKKTLPQLNPWSPPTLASHP
jgi:hypothetical protein